MAGLAKRQPSQHRRDPPTITTTTQVHTHSSLSSSTASNQTSRADMESTSSLVNASSILPPVLSGSTQVGGVSVSAQETGSGNHSNISGEPSIVNDGCRVAVNGVGGEREEVEGQDDGGLPLAKRIKVMQSERGISMATLPPTSLASSKTESVAEMKLKFDGGATKNHTYSPSPIVAMVTTGLPTSSSNTSNLSATTENHSRSNTSSFPITPPLSVGVARDVDVVRDVCGGDDWPHMLSQPKPPPVKNNLLCVPHLRPSTNIPPSSPLTPALTTPPLPPSTPVSLGNNLSSGRGGPCQTLTNLSVAATGATIVADTADLKTCRWDKCSRYTCLWSHAGSLCVT